MFDKVVEEEEESLQLPIRMCAEVFTAWADNGRYHIKSILSH